MGWRELNQWFKALVLVVGAGIYFKTLMVPYNHPIHSVLRHLVFYSDICEHQGNTCYKRVEGKTLIHINLKTFKKSNHFD